jgi:hypothetical protein
VELAERETVPGGCRTGRMSPSSRTSPGLGRTDTATAEQAGEIAARLGEAETEREGLATTARTVRATAADLDRATIGSRTAGRRRLLVS